MTTQTYIAFLRGINVGGHHKVPMADLKKECTKLGLENVVTVLNSGNIIFESTAQNILNLEEKMSKHLEVSFGFPIPTLLRSADVIHDLLQHAPFKNIQVTREIRLYVSFLPSSHQDDMPIPWISDDGSYRIIEKRDASICSVLDLSISKTTTAMHILEKKYGNHVTTRNWNTLLRIGKKLDIDTMSH